MTKILFSISVLLFTTKLVCCIQEKSQPHIVMIIADDMGWNDVGFHGSNQIPTPNIDALAYNGVILNKFYTLPQCTASRASLLTGQYPIRIGYQGLPLYPGENRHLPFEIPTLASKLKNLGYSTHLVGKWHLGYAYKNVTPIGYGFDSHFGYWNPYVGYFNHECGQEDMIGLDMHHNLKPAWETKGQYATHVFTKRSEEVIRMHNESKPLFLMVSHLAVHTGKGNVDLEVPDMAENNNSFYYIKSEKRRLYAGVTSELDKSIGNIIKALSDKGILDNTIIMFFSDNGAPTIGVHLQENSGSNWPLRGQKQTMFDGGIRTAAAVYSKNIQNKGFINNELIHISDLMPTFYHAAGGNVKNLGKIDGINQWETIFENGKLKRTEVLINIDEVNNASAILGEKSRFKLIIGSTLYYLEDGDYYGESGRDDPANPKYNTTAILYSTVNQILRGSLTEDKISKLRKEASIKNCRKSNGLYNRCEHNTVCLFDLLKDLCETTNVADKYPDIVNKLKNKLEKYRLDIIKQKEVFVDPRANPIYYNNTWHTWLDANLM